MTMSKPQTQNMKSSDSWSPDLSIRGGFARKKDKLSPRKSNHLGPNRITRFENERDLLGFRGIHGSSILFWDQTKDRVLVR